MARERALVFVCGFLFPLILPRTCINNPQNAASLNRPNAGAWAERPADANHSATREAGSIWEWGKQACAAFCPPAPAGTSFRCREERVCALSRQSPRGAGATLVAKKQKTQE